MHACVHMVLGVCCADVSMCMHAFTQVQGIHLFDFLVYVYLQCAYCMYVV